MGNKILNNPEIPHEDLKISQWEVYDKQITHPPADAVSALLTRLRERGENHLMIETGIIIAPGYTFRIINGLITNFHMPQSTLLLLVSEIGRASCRERG